MSSMKHEAHFTNNLEKKLWLVYVILQKKTFYQKIILKMWPGNSFRPFLIFQECSVKINRRRSAI